MRTKQKIILASLTICLLSSIVYAEDIKDIQLPSPQTDGGKPLMQALKDRKSAREFSSKELSLQVISDMLWAANGINRPDSGYRTPPR